MPYFVYYLHYNHHQCWVNLVITNDVLYQLSYSGTFLVWLCYDRGNVKSTPARRTLCQAIGGGEIRLGSCRPVVRVRVFCHGLDG